MKDLKGFIRTTIREFLNEQHSNVIGYHISLSKNDNDIIKNGIKPKNGKIYVWLDEGFADWFRDIQFGDKFDDYYKPSTKYTIDLSGFNLIRDPEAEDMSVWSSIYDKNTFGEAYIIKDDKIEPNRIINIEKY